MALISHWPLDGHTRDIAGRTSSSGSPTYTSGKLGQGVVGDGTNISVTLNGALKDVFSGNEMSISLWWNQYEHSGTYDWRDVFAFDSVRLERARAGNTNNADFWCNIGSPGGDQIVTYNTGVPSGEWFHLAIVRRPGALEGWVNGSKILSDSYSGGAMPTIGSDLQINPRNSGSDLDDVRIYNHALSTHEIKELARAKTAHYTFPQGKPTDKSAQNNQGTINGDPQTVDGIIGPDALEFDGANGDRVKINNDTPAGDPALTLCAWGKANATTMADWSGLISVETGSSTNQTLTINYDGGSNNMTLHTWGNSTAGFNLDTNWHHYAAVNTGNGGQEFYVDGNLIGTMSQTLSLPGGASYLGMRAQYGTSSDRVWDGVIDDARVYHRALTQSEIQDLYQTKARISENHRLFTHSLNEGAFEGFRGGTLGPDWNTPNVYVKSDTAYYGDYSIGSSGQGSVDADWTPPILDGGRQINSFSYWWWETTSQGGHQVRLYDSSGNKVQQSETENPQWQMSDGSGSMNTIRGYDSNHYQNWTLFRMEFDWEAGTYDYFAKNSTGQTRSGSYGLINATDVAKVSLVGTNGEYCRFDGFKINDEDVSKEGVFGASNFSEVGPAADSLQGWWDFGRKQANDKAGLHDGTLNGNASIVGDQFGGMALQCDGDGDYVDIGTVGSELAFGTGDFTISALVTFNSTGNYRTILELSRYSHGILFRPDGNEVDIFVNGSSWKPNIGFSNGETCSLTITRTNGTVELYKNATSQGTNGLSGSVDIQQKTYIGASVHNTSQSFDGKIHDLRIYDRALSPEEVSILYEMSGPDPSMKMTSEGIYAPSVSETQL